MIVVPQAKSVRVTEAAKTLMRRYVPNAYVPRLSLLTCCYVMLLLHCCSVLQRVKMAVS